MSQNTRNPAGITRLAFRELKAEYERIKYLLESPDDYAGQDAATIKKVGDRLQTKKGAALRALADLEKAINEGDSKTAWKRCASLRNEIMPTLANELLSVLGGLYVRQKQLDDARQRFKRNGNDTITPLSFSELAELLVIEDLKDRSGKGWESVLIVGEEQLHHSEAEIIRLRFPGCNIWHLPFSAHEYGYLVARKTEKVPVLFRKLRDKVRLQVDPGEHDFGSPPEQRECFLPDVVELWAQYHGKLHAEETARAFLEKHSRRIQALAEQQEAHLCRLFADAFATFFVGPAYVQALLHLQFTPDDRPSAGFPPFSHRYVFAFETLRWMNDMPLVDAGKNRGLFQTEIAELPLLWQSLHQELSLPDPYEAVCTHYAAWLQEVQAALRDEPAFFAAVEITYDNYREANKLWKKLDDDTLTVPTRPSTWAVINAAWLARWAKQVPEEPETTESITDLIERVALRLLDRADKEIISAGTTSRSGSRLDDATRREGDVERIKKYLASQGDLNLLQQWATMARTGEYSNIPEIAIALSDARGVAGEESLLDVYIRLVSN